MQLFCFSHAGGTTAFFDRLENACSERLKLIKLEYSGHGRRMKEPLYKTLREITEDLYDVIRDINFEEEYCLAGYSMGSLVAVDMFIYIREKGEMPLPKHIFIAAHAPEDRIDYLECDDSQNDEIIKNRTIGYGAVPDNLINNSAFWRLYLPIYRADYEVINSFDSTQIDMIENVPLTVFYSDEDTPWEKIKKWDRIFKYTDYVKYVGNHFFYNEYYMDMAEIIQERLQLNGI